MQGESDQLDTESEQELDPAMAELEEQLTKIMEEQSEDPKLKEVPDKFIYNFFLCCCRRRVSS